MRQHFFRRKALPGASHAVSKYITSSTVIIVSLLFNWGLEPGLGHVPTNFLCLPILEKGPVWAKENVGKVSRFFALFDKLQNYENTRGCAMWQNSCLLVILGF